MILSMLEQALIALPLLLGGYITLSLLKLPDFSLESAYLFGAVMAYVAKDCPLPCILLSATLGGIVVGSIVATMNQLLKLPFLLGAIITNGLFHGLTQYILGTSMASFHPALPCSEPLLFSLIAVSLIAILGLLLRSQMGYSLAIYGNNPLFFQHHPISGRSVLYFGVMVGHGCAAIGGSLFAISNGLVDLTMNFGVILLCLTALVVGKSIIRTESPNLLIPLVGLIAYFCIQQTLLQLGFNLKYFNSFQALFVLGTLCLLQKKKKLSLDHLGV